MNMTFQPLRAHTILEEGQDEEPDGTDAEYRREWVELGHDDSAKDEVVTLTGMIKHGDQAGENVEVKIHLNDLSNSHFFKLRKKPKDKIPERCLGLVIGPHITLFTLMCIPVVFVLSLCGSFYMGTWTWYNLNVYFSEERTIFHKIFICPVLVLTFPFTITLSSIAIGFYSAFIQISWYFSSWWKEIRDFEKGFYGWFCNAIGLAECSPYKTVVLNDHSELI